MIKYVIGHWTAGNYAPSAFDKQHYQLLIAGDGKAYKGADVGTSASTGGMNSVTYNIAACGGLSRTPIKPVQIESFLENTAKILKKMNLTERAFYTHAEIGELTRNYAVAHGIMAKPHGFIPKFNNRQITEVIPYNKWLLANISKIDLTILPYNNFIHNGVVTPKITVENHGDFLRSKLKWYLQHV